MLDVCRFFSVRVSTISIFVGMQVREVAGLPSCWLVVIVKLRRGSGKDRQGMAPKVEGLNPSLELTL